MSRLLNVAGIFISRLEVMHVRWDTLVKLAVGLLAVLWGAMTPLMQGLLGLMVVDVLTGLLAAYVTKTLSSDVSFRGMAKKLIILLVIAAAWILERQGGIPLPLTNVVAGFYIAHESISAVENASRAGLPVPRILQDALAKLKESPIV